ncbi:MAG: TlpA family protein disulfide reductase [Granulosicoccus sp.]
MKTLQFLMYGARASCLVGLASAALQIIPGIQQRVQAAETLERVEAGTSEASKPGPEQRLSTVDRKVPAFELPSLDSTTMTLDSLKGKPWVINFWATWCPPCIEEIPSMNAAFEALEPQGIGMLAINAGEGAEAVEEFLKKVAIDFPNVLGNADTLPNWSIKALPTTIVVDSQGNVVYEALGPREWDDERLLQKVVDLL